jgi:bifunctional UDP-N-acetylglucosamine pyrophosphorylase/glucosamine-1-phosphate N-acetyltransferase
MNNLSQKSDLAVVILAAGQGTRMKSKLPKVMHKIAGRPMINWLIETAESLNPQKIIVVSAPGVDDLAEAVYPHIVAIQETQRGTGDAVKPALPHLEGFKGKVLILLGDEPFVDVETLHEMIAHDGLSVMAVEQDFPTSLGRMILNDDGTLDCIVEEKDCTDEQREVTTRNAGNFCIPAVHLSKWLSQLENKNAQGEYYLTDIPKLAQQDGFETRVIETFIDGDWGINTRMELASHEMLAQDMLCARAMENGATLIDPSSVTLAWDTRIGQDVVIEPHVVFGTGVNIADNVIIYAFSHIAGTRIDAGAEIGPFARIRPKSVIEEGASVGNFIEVNRSTMKAGSKAKHMSYIGDATIGEKSNIGAGTVIANYDGFFKHQSTIGKNVFVGSNSTIISPVEVGDGAIVAANSTINKNVSDNALAVARARQSNHAGWASEYRKMKTQQKEAQEED